ncbi:MAG: class I SAM-dependent RNA methyltransferase [bacterium]|nr:class I SAM-dependent RNA methyltransferase [bacterium]
MKILAPEPLLAGTSHTAEIASIAAGGAGIARLLGRVIFIPRTAPGDIVRFRISKDKGKFLLGELEEVQQEGPWRREPPCLHWHDCGGCPLQQMDHAGQNQAKRRIFDDAIQRIGKFTPGAPAAIMEDRIPEFGYRLRVKFHIHRGKIGFFSPGSRRIVPLETCLLVEPAIAGALPAIRQLLEESQDARRAEAVEVTALGPVPGEGVGLLVFPPGSRDSRPGTSLPIPKRMRAAWETFARQAGWPCAFAGERAPGEPPAWRAAYRLDIPGGAGRSTLAMEVSPEAFVQSNREGNQVLVNTVLAAAGAEGEGRVTDLFCGAGNFSLPLSLNARRVIGVEENPFSHQDALANAERAGSGNVRFLRGAAEKTRPEEICGELGGPPDLVLLDPPRKGALEAIPLVLNLAPRRIVYVSCNPATFARDARELWEEGYRLASAAIVPMFPQTAHVETVTSWTRENPRQDGAHSERTEDSPCS